MLQHKIVLFADSIRTSNFDIKYKMLLYLHRTPFVFFFHERRKKINYFAQRNFHLKISIFFFCFFLFILFVGPFVHLTSFNSWFSVFTHRHLTAKNTFTQHNSVRILTIHCIRRRWSERKIKKTDSGTEVDCNANLHLYNSYFGVRYPDFSIHLNILRSPFFLVFFSFRFYISVCCTDLFVSLFSLSLFAFYFIVCRYVCRLKLYNTHTHKKNFSHFSTISTLRFYTKKKENNLHTSTS